MLSLNVPIPIPIPNEVIRTLGPTRTVQFTCRAHHFNVTNRGQDAIAVFNS